MISILKLPRAVPEEVSGDPVGDGAGDPGADDLRGVLRCPHQLLNAGQAVHVGEAAGAVLGALV